MPKTMRVDVESFMAKLRKRRNKGSPRDGESKSLVLYTDQWAMHKYDQDRVVYKHYLESANTTWAASHLPSSPHTSTFGSLLKKCVHDSWQRKERLSDPGGKK